MRLRTYIPGSTVRPGLLAGLVAGLMASGCGRQAAAPDASSQVVPSLAVVDGQPVTEADFRHWWGRRSGPADSPQARQEVLNQLIERSALAAAARRAGLDRDPELAAEVDRLLIARLHSTRLKERMDRVEVPEAELAAEYERGRTTRYRRPEQVRAAVLWFDTHGQAPLAERYRPRLEAVRAELAQAGLPATNGFGQFALANSEHRVSRHRGGDLGWLPNSPSQDAWRTEVMRLAGTLREPGEVSEISTSPAGLFLVRLIGREPGGEQPYAAAREQILRSLLTERRRRVEDRFRQETLEAARIERPPDTDARLAALSLTVPTNAAFAAIKTGPATSTAAPTPAIP